MSKPQLRPVQPGETQPKRKLTVAEAAATGDQLATLIATRDRIAVAVSSDKCSPRDLAALTKRLDDIIEKIKTLEGADAHGDDDEAIDVAFDASAI